MLIFELKPFLINNTALLSLKDELLKQNIANQDL